MNYLIVGLLFGIIFVVLRTKYTKNKLLQETKEKDIKLKIKKEEIDRELKSIELGIEKIKEDRKRERDERAKKSREERADDWND